uniref:AN1-type domain-containing protein n=1 Tax=Angiostrongylus cantonensis TaxID=6313 RepID=A0A158P7V3_ANGCA
MYSVGVRAASTLKLVVVAKSGPLTGRERDEQLMLSDEVSDREYRRRSHRGCSAAEDTSAKESSAGETEKELDMDDEKKLTRVVLFTLISIDFLGAYEECAPLLSAEDSQTPGESTSFGTLTMTLDKFQSLRVQSPIGEEVLSEDPSELSSGMIVRRHRHAPAPSTCRQRARSKPRVTHRERSSSDDNENSQTEPVLFALPLRRGVSARSVRTVAFRGGAARCSVCAFRISSAFNCRCGKTLCSRHRAAQSHTCSKIRTKMQQVSD